MHRLRVPLVVLVFVFSLLCLGCGQGGNAGGGGGTGQGGTDVETFNLPADADKLAGVATVSFRPGNSSVGTIVVNVSNLKQPIELAFERGMLLDDVNGEASLQWIVREVTSYTVDPGGRNTEVAIKGATRHLVAWDQKVDLVISKNQSQTADAKWLAAYEANSKDVEDDIRRWSQQQLGIWIINDNPALEELHKVQVAIGNQMQFAMGVQMAPVLVASYTTMRAVAEKFAKAGLSADDYQSFAQNHALFTEVYDRFAIKDWSAHPTKASLGIFDRMNTFRSEPKVQQLLLDYMANHTDFNYRLQAMQKLAQWGEYPNSDDERWETARDVKQPRMVRISAINSLLWKDRPEVFPVAAAYVHDTAIEDAIRGRFQFQLKELTGQAVDGKEPLKAYWQRVTGWDDLSKSYPDTADLKNTIKAIEKLEQAYVSAQLAKLEGGDEKSVREACLELARRFPTNERVLEKLNNTALKHNEPYVRVAALDGLARHTEFDIAPIAISWLKNEKDKNILSHLFTLTVINNLGERQSEFLAIAIEHHDDSVARNAMGRMDLKVPEQAKIIRRLATSSPNAQTRVNALNKLTGRNQERAFEDLKDAAWTQEQDMIAVAKFAIQKVANSFPNPPERAVALLSEVARRHKQPAARADAIDKLGFRFSEAMDYSAFLTERLSSDEASEVHFAVVSAANMRHQRLKRDGNAKPYEAILLQAIKSPHARPRQLAIQRVIQIVEPSEYVAPLVVASETETDVKTISTIYYAIEKSDPAKSGVVMKNWLQMEDSDARADAIYALSRKVGRDADEAALQPYLPHLTVASAMTDDKSRAQTGYFMLQRAGVKDAIVVLDAWLKRDDAQWRKLAVENLVKHHADDPRTEKLLEPLKDTEDRMIKFRVDSFFRDRDG